MKYVLLITFVLVALVSQKSFSAEETVTATVDKIIVDYRGWYRFTTTPSANTQNCSTGMFMLSNNASADAQKLMFSALLTAKATGSQVELVLSGCTAETGDVTVWAVSVL